MAQYAEGGMLLELGCGDGRDTQVIKNIGPVVVGDISGNELNKCKRKVPGAFPVLLDVSGPFPFADACFKVIVASLCIHYFTWSDTIGIRDEIRRTLADGGLFLLRVNSTNDIHYGATGYLELEAGLYNVKGRMKRFFTRDNLLTLFNDGWLVKSMEELTVARYEKSKNLWELILEKT